MRTPSASLVVGVLIAAVLQVLVSMALFYALHRVLFARRDPLTAMEDSFKACLHRVWAIAGLTAVYAVPYLLVAGAFGVSRPVGYVLLLSVGLVSLPAFVIATYRSYGEVFPPPRPG